METAVWSMISPGQGRIMERSALALLSESVFAMAPFKSDKKIKLLLLGNIDVWWKFNLDLYL